MLLWFKTEEGRRMMIGGQRSDVGKEKNVPTAMSVLNLFLLITVLLLTVMR